MLWLSVILITSVLSSSYVPEVYDHGQPFTFSQTDTFGDQWDILTDQEYNEEKIDDEIQDNDVYIDTYTSDRTDDSSSYMFGSVSDNGADNQEDNGEGNENETIYSGYDDSGIRSDLAAVTEQLREVGQQTADLRVIEETQYDLLTYICGIAIFILLVVILKYIYKFFRIFF